MAFPIKVRREDNFGDFHMITDVTISQNGRFDAVTETNNHVALNGNCGTVTIWLQDKDGNNLSRHGGQQFCVDGTALPFSGPSVRKDVFDFTIASDILSQVTGVSILHGEGSKNFLDLIAENIEKAKSVVQDIQALRQ